MCSVDPEVLWPHVTLDQVHRLRELPPIELYDEATITCPVCGAEAYISADRRIVYCIFRCQRAMPGPASDQLLQALRRRRQRRGRTIRRTI